MKQFVSVIALLIFFASGVPVAAVNLQSDVGHVELANSGNKEAQVPFLRGLAQLHNFQYRDAAVLFRAAQAADPDFALAYWGEAMTFNHAIWKDQDKDKALAALAKLGPTAEERIAKAPEGLERDLLSAAHILFGAGNKEDNDDAYLAFMAALFKKHPHNVEVASQYALSIMGSAHEGREFSLYMRSAAIMSGFFETYKTHPAVLHYLIHATDDPVHAPLGLRAAYQYEDVAPNAAHAQHMTTHIYLAMGMWEDVIRANIKAYALARGEGREVMPHCGHYSSWLMYGYLQVGNVPEAKKIMDACYEIASGAGKNHQQTNIYYAWMKELYLYDTGDWNGPVADMHAAVEGNPPMAYIDATVSRLAAVMQGDMEEASGHFARRAMLLEGATAKDSKFVLPDIVKRLTGAMDAEIEARILASAGQYKDAIALMTEAADQQRNRPFGFGPPRPALPAFEYLTHLLIKDGQFDIAAKILAEAESRTPNKASLKKLGAMLEEVR